MSRQSRPLGGNESPPGPTLLLSVFLFFAGLSPAPVLAASESTAGPEDRQEGLDLAEISLEELMNLEVRLVSRQSEKLTDAPAAVYVITQEDIRRSGYSELPEVLRLAPGLETARIDLDFWAVTARGFNGRYANKLLVLVDGRSVYLPTFSGVEWGVQDMVLSDIDRIEVIRGPGATMWGANAVNGIVNIVTKKASETQGLHWAGGTGSGSNLSGEIRYGGRLGDRGHFRAFARRSHQDELSGAGSTTDSSELEKRLGGFRLDWDADPKLASSVQGGFYDDGVEEEQSQTLLVPPYSRAAPGSIALRGFHILASRKRLSEEGGETSLRAYFDHNERRSQALEERYSTFDLDFQQTLAPTGRHRLIWGLGLRQSVLDTNGTFTASFSPSSHENNLYSGFLQDEISLSDERLRMILGSKFERNDVTGWEVQPSMRLVWKPSEDRTVWAGVSRAARTPDASDLNLRVNAAAFPSSGGTTNLISVLGDKGFESEHLTAYELGYRVRPSEGLYLEASAFVQRYSHLETEEFGAPYFETSPPPAHLVIPIRFSNQAKGVVKGLEFASHWDVTDRWKLKFSYVDLQIDVDRADSGADSFGERSSEGASPQRQFKLRSYCNVTEKVEFDAMVYAIGSLRNLGTEANPKSVPAYVRVDARLGWRLGGGREISVSAQNLFDRGHMEFEELDGVSAANIGRSVSVKFSRTF